MSQLVSELSLDRIRNMARFSRASRPLKIASSVHLPLFRAKAFFCSSTLEGVIGRWNLLITLTEAFLTFWSQVKSFGAPKCLGQIFSGNPIYAKPGFSRSIEYRGSFFGVFWLNVFGAPKRFTAYISAF